jgi:hypothetical protein
VARNERVARGHFVRSVHLPSLPADLPGRCRPERVTGCIAICMQRRPRRHAMVYGGVSIRNDVVTDMPFVWHSVVTPATHSERSWALNSPACTLTTSAQMREAVLFFIFLRLSCMT